MVISRLFLFAESDGGALLVCIRWEGVNPEEDIFEPLKAVHEDVPKLLHKLLNRKSTPTLLAMRSRKELGLYKERQCNKRFRLHCVMHPSSCNQHCCVTCM